MSAPSPDLAGLVELPNGQVSPALVVRMDAAVQRRWSVFFAVAAIVALIVAIDPQLSIRSWWHDLAPVGGTILALLLAPFAVNALVAWNEPPLLAIARDGLVMRSMGTTRFVPWGQVTGLAIARRGRRDVVMVAVAQTNSIQRADAVPLLGRFLGLVELSQRRGLPLMPIRADLGLQLVGHYLEVPEDRVNLGSGAEPVLGARVAALAIT